MKSKKTIFILVVSILVVFGGIYFFFFNTYTVSGKITDLANKEAIADVEISIGDVITSTNKDGEFRIENVKKYQSNVLKIRTLVGYEEVAPISLESSEVATQNIEIVPTLEIMVSRFNDALRNSQYDYLWDYMHSDDQEYWGSKEKYIALFKKIDEVRKELGTFIVPNFEIGKNIRALDTWEHKITGKKYANVTEVPVESKFNENESEINLQYYQKIDGVWRYFTETDKTKTQENINEYEKLKNLFSN